MENKNCQNCKKDFEITPDDFSFYEKIKVPAPTFCPECRRIRRFAWRNERSLYRRSCDLCKKTTIAIYHQSSPFPVYCHECWNSDKWNPQSYAKEYDNNKLFFEQYKELSNTVPRVAIFHRNAISSEFAHTVVESRNVYLSFSVTKNSENVFYSKSIDNSRDIMDSMNVIDNSEGLYENVRAQNNYGSQYLLLSRSCLNSYYLIDCANCSNCFMSYNLRNKEFCIRNKQYTKEEYFQELKKLNFKSRKVREELLGEFREINNQAIFRFANINKCVNATGNDLFESKNADNCFELYNCENTKYCYRAIEIKDSMDFDYGLKSELMYEYDTGCLNDSNVKFSYSAINSVRDADYTEWCMNCTNVFGCIGLRDAENAILNKVYSKEEFNKLRSQIIEQMTSMPFIDKKGRVYKYGEFFPIELSPWAYNETFAQQYSPLTKEEVIANGYHWRNPDLRESKVTLETSNIPDDIDDVDLNILKEVLACAHGGKCEHRCTEAFKITDYELKFYKKYSIPLPTLCPNCRHHERSKVMPGLKLYKRTCMKCEKVEFETPYAPDRPEIIYCESCYNKAVY